MEPFKTLIERAWEGLTEGWRELLTRGEGALTHFGHKDPEEAAAKNEFPRWSLLAAETWETAQTIVIRLELPGMNKDDMTVDIHGNMLRIRGEKRSEASQDDRIYHLMERAFGHFERLIPLPPGVDAEHAEISYRDGVLTVILAKSDRLPPRHIEVSK